MRPSANFHPPFESFEIESNPTFNVVIAYEDFEAGKNAKRTYDYLTAQLGNDCQFSSQMWKFEVLNIPKLREMAAKDAISADIVIISCNGKSELPAEVKAWMELWLCQTEGPMALVGLFGNSRQSTGQEIVLRNYLADVARRGQMEYFAQPGDWSVATPFFVPAKPVQLPIENRGLAIASLVQHENARHEHTFPRWGINE